MRHLSIIVRRHMATLVRRLGLWSSIGLVIGITIGGGIFRTPASIATRVPDPLLMMSRVGDRRHHRAVRRARVWRSCRRHARDGRHVRLPARGLGPPLRLSLWMGSARADSRLCARRHLVGVRRVLPADVRHRSSPPPARGPTISRPAPSSSPPSRISSASARRPLRRHFHCYEVRRARAPGGRVVPARWRAGASCRICASTGTAVNAGVFGLALISVMWAYDGFAD